MATSVNNVAQPPLVSPIVDSEGKLNRAWASWFRDLYRRVAYKGGNSIDDNTESIGNIDDELLGVGATIELIIEAVNDNEITMNNHIDADTAHDSNGAIIGADDLATLLAAGLVKMSVLVDDAVNATSSSVSVDSPDVSTAPVAYDQVHIESIVALANETKAKVNILVTDFNTVVTEVDAIVTQLNDLITKSKTAGQMSNV